MTKLILSWIMAFAFFAGLSITYVLCRLINRIAATGMHWFGKLSLGLGVCWLDVGIWIVVGSFIIVLLDSILNEGGNE